MRRWRPYSEPIEESQGPIQRRWRIILNK
jgi:hypothetical protein